MVFFTKLALDPSLILILTNVKIKIKMFFKASLIEISENKKLTRQGTCRSVRNMKLKCVSDKKN